MAVNVLIETLQTQFIGLTEINRKSQPVNFQLLPFEGGRSRKTIYFIV